MSLPRVLLDENLPIRLRLWLVGVDAQTVAFLGWKGVRNGELVERAKSAGFTALVTADRPLAMAPRAWKPLGCVFVSSSDQRRLQAGSEQIAAACRSILPGQVIVVTI